jgi:hypothetical protein
VVPHTVDLAGHHDGIEADNTVARLERLPFGRVHFRVASLLGVGTFFDAFDSLVNSESTAVFTTCTRTPSKA